MIYAINSTELTDSRTDEQATPYGTIRYREGHVIKKQCPNCLFFKLSRRHNQKIFSHLVFLIRCVHVLSIRSQYNAQRSYVRGQMMVSQTIPDDISCTDSFNIHRRPARMNYFRRQMSSLGRREFVGRADGNIVRLIRCKSVSFLTLGSPTSLISFRRIIREDNLDSSMQVNLPL